MSSLKRHQRLSLVEKDLRKDNMVKSKRLREDLDLLAMKRPTNVDDVRARIPNPRETLPANALPEWKERGMDAKIPIIPAPSGTFLISQGRVGTKLFVSTPNQDFDMQDPRITETPVQYQPLHDPNLREYFHTNPVVCKQLVDLGLVTCDGKVIARVNDFNKYRTYLSRVHNGQVSREKNRMEHWTKSEFEKGVVIKRYLKKVISDRCEEDRKRRREKSKVEMEERNRQRRLKSLQHPSNYLKEKRFIEARIRKAKRDALHKNVMDRLKRIRDADKRRARHTLLESICKDQLREKLRNVLKLEKELNKQDSLAEFVENKRSFQEGKRRYKKALLLRDSIEKECRIQKLEDRYEKRREQDAGRMVRNKEAAVARAARETYLIKKYGYRWLDMVRRQKRESMHDSAWHIRTVVASLLQYLRSESGAKTFTEYLHDMLAQNRSAPIDPETKKVVMVILDILIERSYREFIRRATSCLVDFVVEESRKRCLGFICQAGLDPEDLASPIVPQRKRGKIQLTKPTYPLEGPCTDFARTGEWPSRCVQELERIHGKMCQNLLRKLKSGIRAARSAGADLDRLECGAKKARKSRRVCQAVDMVSRMAMARARGCFKSRSCGQAKKMNSICDGLVSTVLGSSQAAKGKKSFKRRSAKRGKVPRQGMGPAGSLGTRGTTEAHGGEYATSDSEVDGAQIVPLTDSSAGMSRADAGIGGPLQLGRDQGVAGRAGARDKGIGRAAGAHKGVSKPGPRKVSMGTAGARKQDIGSAPGSTGASTTAASATAQGRGQGVGPGKGLESGVGPQGTLGTTESATNGLEAAEESAQTEPGAPKGDGTTSGPSTTEGGVGDKAATSESGTAGATMKDSGGIGQASQDGGTDSPEGVASASKSTTGPDVVDKAAGKPGGKGAGAGPDGVDGESTGVSTDAGEDKGMGKDKVPGADAATSGEPGASKKVGEDGSGTSSDGTQDEPGVEKGAGGPGGTGVEKGTAGEKPGESAKGVGEDGGIGSGTQAEGPDSVSAQAGKDGTADGSTEGKGPEGQSKATEGLPGAEDGTQSPTGVEGGTQDPTRVDDGTQGPTVAEDGTQGPTGVEDGTQGPAGVEDGTQAQSGVEDGTQGPTGVEDGTQGPTAIDDGTQGPGGPTDPKAVGKDGKAEDSSQTGAVPTDTKDSGKDGAAEGGSQADKNLTDTQGTEGPEGTDAGTAGEEAVDQGIQGEAVPKDSQGVGKDKLDDGTQKPKDGTTSSEAQETPETGTIGTTPESKTDQSTDTSTPTKSSGTEQPGTQDASVEQPGATAKDDGTEGPSTDSKGTGEPGVDEQGVGTPGSTTTDKETEGRPGEEAGVGADEATVSDDKSTSPEDKKEDGTDADGGVPGDEKASGTVPGTEDGSQAGTKPESDKETGTQPGTDRTTDAEGAPGQDQGAGPEAGQDSGTQAQVSGEDAGAHAIGPDGLEQAIGPDGTLEDGTSPDGTTTKSEGVEGPLGQDVGEGTGPGGPLKGQDGAQTDRGEEIGTSSETQPGEDQAIGASVEGEEKGTEPPEGAERGDQTTPPGGASVDTLTEGLGPDKSTGATDGTTQGDESEGPCARGAQPCRPCAVPCPPDGWDGKEITEEELESEVTRVDELLDNVKNELVQKCASGEDSGGPMERPSEREVSRVVSSEIDDLLTNELGNLMADDSCLAKAGEYLKDKCAGLSGESRDKCLAEAAKQLREQCLTLSPEMREKCLAEVGKLLSGPTTAATTDIETSDDDLSRNASGLIEAILREQRSKLTNELAVVGSGDEAAIGRILSDDNISRIASALVKQSICVAKCGNENLASIGFIVPSTAARCAATPSPAVRCAVREKLQHIRSILDEVKSDLAQVGIHPTFNNGVRGSESAAIVRPSVSEGSAVRKDGVSSATPSKSKIKFSKKQL